MLIKATADEIINLGFLLVCAAGPIGLFFLLLRHLENPLFNRTSAPTTHALRHHFLAKMITLSHSNDEAVAGLKAASKFERQIFEPRFAHTPLLIASLVALPFLAYLFNIWFRFAFPLWSATRPPILNQVVWWISVGMLDPFVSFSAFMSVFGLEVAPISPKSLQGVGYGLLLITYSTAQYFLVSLTLLVVAFYPTLSMSAYLSRRFNRAAWSQIRRSAFGGDLKAEVAVAADAQPKWVYGSGVRLPAELEAELQGEADEAASRAVSKLRDAIGELAFSLNNQDKLVAVSKFITWDELIHTVYFKVPRFRKLVCYAIAHSSGFRPSEMLKTDPDYEKLGQWLAEIQGQVPAPAAAASATATHAT
jgi:hypothetical protein